MGRSGPVTNAILFRNFFKFSENKLVKNAVIRNFFTSTNSVFTLKNAPRFRPANGNKKSEKVITKTTVNNLL